MNSAFERLTQLSLKELSDTQIRRQWHLSPHQSADCWRDLLSTDDVSGLISDFGLRFPLVILVKDGAHLPSSAYTTADSSNFDGTDGYIDPDKVLKHFAEGATIQLRQMERYWPPVRKLAQQLMIEVGHRVQIAAFITPAETPGLKPHYDDHDVFILQISGRKEWHDLGSAVTDPLAVHAWMHLSIQEKWRIRTESSTIRKDVLAAGDSLYVPRGRIHAAEALNEVSIHITVGLYAMTRYDVLTAAHEIAADDIWFRQSLPLGQALSPDRFYELLASTGERLTQLADERRGVKIGPKALGLLGGAAPEPLRLLDQYDALASLDMERELALRAGLAYSVEETPESLIIYLNGRHIRLSPQYRHAMMLALSGTPFTLGELGDLPEDKRVQWARLMLLNGVLVPSGDNPVPHD